MLSHNKYNGKLKIMTHGKQKKTIKQNAIPLQA